MAVEKPNSWIKRWLTRENVSIILPVMMIVTGIVLFLADFVDMTQENLLKLILAVLGLQAIGNVFVHIDSLFEIKTQVEKLVTTMGEPQARFNDL
ncbi:MAG: hypothetical protein JXA10_18995, partial [Anaerolineae bacterium]|nr:hypothetical protein [Anaerolineae bacterium]